MPRKIKEDDCGIARIKWGAIELWSQGSNQRVWRMQVAGNSVGKVVVQTNRERKNDPSGMKKWRVVTSHKLTVSLYVGRMEIVLNEKLHFHGSLKDALKSVCEGYQTEHLHRMIEWELEQQAQALGIDKVEIWNVEDRAIDTIGKLSNLKNLIDNRS